MFFSFKKLILLVSIFNFSSIIIQKPILSHGNSEDCSMECNDYYCPEDKTKKGNKSNKVPIRNNIN